MLWGLVDNGMLQRAKYHNITLLINRAIITMILQSSSPLSESTMVFCTDNNIPSLKFSIAQKWMKPSSLSLSTK